MWIDFMMKFLFFFRLKSSPSSSKIGITHFQGIDRHSINLFCFGSFPKLQSQFHLDYWLVFGVSPLAELHKRLNEWHELKICQKCISVIWQMDRNAMGKTTDALCL